MRKIMRTFLGEAFERGVGRRSWAQCFLCVLGVFLVGTVPAFGQDHQVTGTVTDAETGLPLPGVNVVVKGATIGAATDAKGIYELTVPSAQDTLVLSFIGYEAQEVAVAGRSRVDVALVPDVSALNEVVVVGYGTQEAENVTGAVSTVDVAEFSNRAITDATNALQGQVPGLTVFTRSGEPGADGGTLRVRGLGTLGDNAPLVLVDGIPTSLSDVAPGDIKSITVLKDASAAAIYGVRAANGVILVTTKRGPRDGEIQFSYQGYVGAQTPTRLPDYLGSADFARLYNEALANEGKDPIYTQEEVNKFESGSDPIRYPNTQWLDLVLKDYALQQSHYFGLSGGSESSRYRISFRYLNQKGVIPNIELNEYNLRVNFDTDINERLHLAVSLAGVREVEDRPYSSAGTIFSQLLRTPPTIRVHNPDGTWPHVNYASPLRTAMESGYDTWEETRLRGSATAEYQLLEGLSAKARFGIDTYDGLHEGFRNQLATYSLEGEAFETAPPSGFNWDGHKQSVTLEAFLNFEQTFFSNHHIEGVVGYSQENYRDDWFGASVLNLPNNFIHELDAGDPETEENEGAAESWAIRSVFGRLQYSLLDRYLLSGTFRYDGSSRFPEGQRYGLFPSFSAAWRLSEEPFFNVDVISNLKLRASWGQLGNDDVGLYSFWPTYSLETYPFGGQVTQAVVESRLPNRDITWETATVTDVGIDVGLFEHRLSLTVDYFYKMTEDILIDIPIPTSVGISAPPQNAASVLNRGWEFAGTYRDDIGDLGFSISGNLTFTHNEITDLAGTGLHINGTYGDVVGDPINSIYGYEAVGLFQSEEEVDNHAFQDPFTAPGDIIYRDQNGDDVIDAEDRVYLGSYFPGITYGATFTANYKGFDLRVFLQGVSDVKGYLTAEASQAFFNGGKVMEWHLDRWTPENRDASYPRLLLSLFHNRKPSSFWVQDASYLRVKNVQLGYTLPTSLLSRFGVSRMRVYVNADNLYTFTGFRGFDPEAPLGRGWFYPQVTTYTFGINLNI